MKDSSKIICLILLCVIMTLLCSCSGNAAMRYAEELEEMQTVVDSLEDTIQVLEAKIDYLEAARAAGMAYEITK